MLTQRRYQFRMFRKKAAQLRSVIGLHLKILRPFFPKTRHIVMRILHGNF
jgi:hypothetical protein